MTHNKWARALDEGHQVDVVFFDFSKGFDHIPHQTLLHKLCNFGISGKLLNWCQHYLSTRRQRVVINGYSFSLTEITSGVPQGSILGPLEVNAYNYPSCSQTCSYVQQILDCLPGLCPKFTSFKETSRVILSPCPNPKWCMSDSFEALIDTVNKIQLSNLCYHGNSVIFNPNFFLNQHLKKRFVLRNNNISQFSHE